MPKVVEDRLKKEAAKKHLTGDRARSYIYGTLQKITDWKPGQEKHREGQVLGK